MKMVWSGSINHNIRLPFAKALMIGLYPLNLTIILFFIINIIYKSFCFHREFGIISYKKYFFIIKYF